MKRDRVVSETPNRRYRYRAEGAVKGRNGLGRKPLPACVPSGAPEKVQILVERCRRGEELWHEDDLFAPEQLVTGERPNGTIKILGRKKATRRPKVSAEADTGLSRFDALAARAQRNHEMHVSKNTLFQGSEAISVVSVRRGTIGSRVLEAMQAAGLRRKELCRTASISRACLSRLLRDERKPTVSVLVSVADALKVSVDWLLGRKCPA